MLGIDYVPVGKENYDRAAGLTFFINGTLKMPKIKPSGGFYMIFFWKHA